MRKKKLNITRGILIVTKIEARLKELETSQKN
jgi:hypothetical protein